MATSGSSNFSLTRNEICQAALRKLVATPAGVPMTSQMLTDASQALNAMVKHWAAKGMHVWTTTEATLFVQPNQASYTVGTGGTAHCTQTYEQDQVATNALAGAGTITLADATGFTSGMNIGVTLDDGTIQWTTINGAPVGDVVTLTAALTDDVAEDNLVWAYTSDIVQPLKIRAARRWNTDTDYETPLTMVSRADYREYPNKTQSGTVTTVTYDRQLSIGTIYLWNAPQDVVNNHVRFTWDRPIMDFDTAADDTDLPQEWVQTLIFNLAVVMAPEFEVSDASFSRIKGLADEYLGDMIGFDREEASIFLQPDYSGLR